MSIAKNRARRKRGYLRHDAAAPIRVSGATNGGRSRAHSGRRRPQGHASRGRHGPAAKYEAAAAGSEDPDEPEPHSGIAPKKALKCGSGSSGSSEPAEIG